MDYASLLLIDKKNQEELDNQAWRLPLQYLRVEGLCYGGEELSWDGSYLGEISPPSSLLKDKNKSYYFFPQFQCWFHVRPYSTFSCFADELKELFGVLKTGTHSAYWNKKRWNIYRTWTWKGMPLRLASIKGIDEFDESDAAQIQKILAFRDILRARSNFESNILVLPYLPRRLISVGEVSQENVKEKNTFSNKTYYHWFDGDTLAETLLYIFEPVLQREGFEGGLYYLSRRIEDIILRIDRELIYLQSPIIERLTKRLMKFYASF